MTQVAVGAVAHVLVPLKRLDGAKTRLAELLPADQRAGLMRAMLQDVLEAVRGARGVARITLVSSDPSAESLARESGIEWWHDQGLAWNSALFAAMQEIVAESCATVVSADLPLLVSAEIESLIAATPARGLAIARASDAGTNAVSLRPPAALHTCFGARGSAELHARTARGRGLEAVVLDRPGLALDIDTSGDLERFLSAGRRTRTRAFLDSLGLGEADALPLAATGAR